MRAYTAGIMASLLLAGTTDVLHADLRPEAIVSGSPIYVLNVFPTARELSALSARAPTPFFVVRGRWPSAADMARFVHLGAPASLVLAPPRYPEAAQAAILVHAPPSLRIVIAARRLPTAQEARNLLHVGRRIEILAPEALSGGIDDALKGVPNVGAFSGGAALKRALLREAGITPHRRRPDPAPRGAGEAAPGRSSGGSATPRSGRR